MKKTLLIPINMFILILNANMISASDVMVWQGQYYTGTKFNSGTYEFNFSVYDAPTGGDVCYSNTTTLTTGNLGEWITEEIGVNSACNNVTLDYYLNIKIDGVDQLPRRRLTQWNYLRKDVNETTAGRLRSVSHVLAPIVQADSQIIAPIINASEIIVYSDANILGTLRGHSPVRIGDAIQYVDANDSNLFSMYTAGQNVTGSNVSSLYDGVIIHQIESHTNPSGIEECWWDKEDQEMRMCMDRTNVEMWNNLLVNKNMSVTGNSSADTGFFSYLGSMANRITELFVLGVDASGNITASQTGFFGWLGSLSSRINKLWVVDINATGNVETNQNVSAKYFLGNGSLLTNLPPGGITPVYLGSNLTATDAAYETIFTIALTPGKMNIIQAYLAQSSSATGVAIRNRVITSESGPNGYCNFVTQTGAADAVDTIAVSNDSADTGETTMGLDTSVPFMNTVTCTVLADANQKNLMIQFISEAVSTVTTYAGSYYTNAVN